MSEYNDRAQDGEELACGSDNCARQGTKVTYHEVNEGLTDSTTYGDDRQVVQSDGILLDKLEKVQNLLGYTHGYS